MEELTKEQIQEVITQNEKFANAYFWRPPTNASARRAYEKQQTRFYHGTFAGKELWLDLSIGCSCKNIYVNRNFMVNGKKTTIIKIKNLIK